MLLVSLLAILAGMISVPTLVLCVEVLASLAVFRDPLAEHRGLDRSTSAAVVVPAHNEGSGLRPTLEDLRPQLGPFDRLIVVADNCSDSTAEIAVAAGAEVLERNDLSRIGKGYALAHAIAQLSPNPPDMVLFVDADCRVQGDMLARLKDACTHAARPIQACFLMVAPKQSSVDHSLAEFQWIIRNWVRPLGLAGLGLPVQLMGTGMMFPWRLIGDLQMDGNLVEDLKLGLDAAAAGFPPRFYPSVVGTSEFPVSKRGSETQRQRWIQGHLRMIVRYLPKYLLRALVDRNLGLLVLVLDLLVPPFSLFLPLAAMTLFASVALYLFIGAATPLILSFVNVVAIVLAIFLGWIRYGQEIIAVRDIPGLFRSLLTRVRYYSNVYFGPKANTWIRTDRSKMDQ